MTQNPGWIQRVFGARELEDRLHHVNIQLAERDRQVLDLEQQLQTATAALSEREHELSNLRDVAKVSSSRASDHGRELQDKLTRANQDRAALDAALTEARAKLAGVEASFQAKLDRAMSLGKAAAAQNRRADQLAAQVEALEKQLAQVETSAQGSAGERARLQASIADRERELVEKSDLLSAAEWKIATLESELEPLRSEVQRSKLTLIEQASSLEGLRQQEARATAALGQRESVLSLAKDTLLDVLRLSAQALHRTFGVRSHLAIELAARSCWRKPPDTTHDEAHRVLEIRDRLALIGITDDFSAASGAQGCSGRFRLSVTLPETEAAGVARWIAAYAIELLHGASRRPLRLETLDGGPLEFEFLATPRADAATVAISEAPLAARSEARSDALV